MAGDWSMLPLDILAAFAEKLDTLEDLTYFSAVCRSWNCVPPLIKNHWKPKIPWLLLPENTEDNPARVRKIFTLSHSKCYKLKLPETFGARCWGSPYGWVAMIDINLNILLFNPMTEARLSFPHWKTLPEGNDLETYKNNLDDDGNFDEEFRQRIATKLFVLKVSQKDHDEFVIMMLYMTRRRLVVARHGDLSWTPLPLPEGTAVMMSDIISIDDKAYALYNDGAVRYWILKEIGFGEPMTYIPGTGHSFDGFNEIGKFPRLPGIGKMYLIQSDSDLFMLFRAKELEDSATVKLLAETESDAEEEEEDDDDFSVVYQTTNFRILKCVQKDQKWEDVNDLGDIALFVGSNNSMSLSTKHAKYLRRNCVYFTDDENMSWSDTKEFGVYGGHDMGIYDLKSGQTLPLYEGDNILSSFSPATFFIPEPEFTTNNSIS